MSDEMTKAEQRAAANTVEVEYNAQSNALRQWHKKIDAALDGPYAEDAVIHGVHVYADRFGVSSESLGHKIYFIRCLFEKMEASVEI